MKSLLPVTLLLCMLCSGGRTMSRLPKRKPFSVYDCPKNHTTNPCRPFCNKMWDPNCLTYKRTNDVFSFSNKCILCSLVACCGGDYNNWKDWRGRSSPSMPCGKSITVSLPYENICNMLQRTKGGQNRERKGSIEGT